MTIGELARRAGVNVQTVRYYERRALLAEPARRASGYRVYDAETLDRLQFVRRAQALGFTLTEIAELLALRMDPHTTAASVKARAEEKLTAIDEKLRDLARLRCSLAQLTGGCRGGCTPTGECPLLAALGPRHGTPPAAGAHSPERKESCSCQFAVPA
jgi:MerR family transcriptional regulator, copper efflux regulator